MSNHEGSALITVGLLGVRDTDMVPFREILDTIAAQDFPSVELLICPDSDDESRIQELLETLYHLPPDRFLRTRVQPFFYHVGAAKAMEWIIRNAAGKFLIFHTLSETLYDIHVLSNYWSAFQGRGESLGLMRTLVMKKTDQSWRILPETEDYAVLTEGSPAEQFQWLEDAGRTVRNGGMCFRTAALRKTVLPRGAYEEALFSAMLSAGQSGVLVCPEFCATRHYCEEFPEESSLLPLYDTGMEVPPVRGEVLNLTDYLALETAVNAALKISGGPFHKPDADARRELSEKLADLCAGIRAKARGGVWGLTDSQFLLLRYLEDLIHLLDFPGRRVSDCKWLLADAREKRYPVFRVVFFINEYAVWPSLQSLYEAVRARPDMEAQLVYLPFRHVSKTIPDAAEWEAYRAAGYCPLPHDQYQIARECPDVAVYVKPYDDIPHAFTIGETHRVIPRCLYIPYGMETGDDRETMKYQCRCPMQFYAWRIAAYCRDYYEKMRKHTYSGRNYLPCGHPRLDMRLLDYRENADYCSIWEKAGNRKIVLWNTHFSLTGGDGWGTYSLFKDIIFDYFDTHLDMFLLWRPHPLFYGALAQASDKSLEEVNAWFRLLHTKENYYIDKSAGYLPSFAISDAMISDQASFVPEYLSWGKPLLVTDRSQASVALYHSLEPYLPHARNPEDITAFLERIRTTDLPAPSLSDEIIRKMFIPREGTVGGKIAEYLSQQIRKEQADLLKTEVSSYWHTGT